MIDRLDEFLAQRHDRARTLCAERLPALSRSGGSGSRINPESLLEAMGQALAHKDLRALVSLYDLDELGDPNELERHLASASDGLGTIAHVVRQLLDSEKDLTTARRAAFTEAWTGEIREVERQLVHGSFQYLTAYVLALKRAVAAKSASLGITLHELRRPLTIMISYSQLLADRRLGELPANVAAAVEGISAGAEGMAQLVNALSEVTRLEDPDDMLTIEKMPVADLVAGAVAQVATEAALRDMVIDTSGVGNDVIVRGDRKRLNLALTNLMSNAVKYGPPQSTIEVATRTDDYVRITVADQGVGFPPEDAMRLFDKYYRSKNQRANRVPGTGLGLFIVKTVAERHGGTVTARSRNGGGSEFEFAVPI